MIPGPDVLSLAGSIVYFPLGTAVILLLFGQRLERVSFFGRRFEGWTGWIASLSIARSFVAAIMMQFEVLSHPAEERSLVAKAFDWIQVGDLSTAVDFLVDPLSSVMVLVVTGVGTLIHFYSIGYMKGDPRYPRYFAYLNLFAASMLLLVLANNVLLLYVGWEAVGLCSYLLIGFWFERSAAANAAKKAFIVNRIGDFAFLIGIFVLAATVGSLTIGRINAEAGAMTAGIATTISLLLFAGATGKSAQIPLYVWLPDAMEGPTPVSALIHAATMVTAGVYMVARFAPVFEASQGIALTVVAWIGALTALWAALMATAEYDIKRILAYSTISQLGYMFLAHGVHAYSAGIFHLATHAFFKAVMFLGAGAVMHTLAGETDIRKMGGLRRAMPITGLSFLAGFLAISGIVPFAGFFSKDAILASAWAHGEYALWALGIATAALTAFYMARLYFSVFEGDRVEAAHLHDAPPTMATALVALGVLSVIGGVINLPGVLTLEHFLEPIAGESEVPLGLAPWLLAGAALVVGLGGIALGYRLYLHPGGERVRASFYQRVPWLVDAARNKFYVDELYGRYVVLPGKRFAAECADYYDTGIIDGAVNGLARAVARGSQRLRRVQSGYVRNYGAAYLLGVVVIVGVLIVRLA